jgi:hypothetical protein
VPLGAAPQHLLCGDDFLAQPGRGGLDIHNDAVIGVDQIVGLIAEAPAPVLCGPSGLRVGF